MNNQIISQHARSVALDIMGIQNSQAQVVGVSGGYSRNRRALVGSDNRWVFVKEVDTQLLPEDPKEELWWLKKDYLCASELRKIVPALVPEWSQLESDGHILLMTSYRTADGWLWSPPQDPLLRARYIDAVISATKKLAAIKFDEGTIKDLGLNPLLRDELALDDGFAAIMQDDMVNDQLRQKYTSLLSKGGALKQQHAAMIKLLSNKSELLSVAQRAVDLAKQPNDSFGHCDVRSDNLAFHPETAEVRFVDWNWASYTPEGFGATEFLLDMSRRGFDVTPWSSELNIEMLAALVGFYAKRSLKDPLSPGSALRNVQAESASVAYSLYTKAINSRL